MRALTQNGNGSGAALVAAKACRAGSAGRRVHARRQQEGSRRDLLTGNSEAPGKLGQQAICWPKLGLSPTKHRSGKLTLTPIPCHVLALCMTYVLECLCSVLLVCGSFNDVQLGPPQDLELCP